MTVNLNELAKEVCYGEGGNEQVGIGQIKEILNFLFINYELAEIIGFWLKYQALEERRRKAHNKKVIKGLK